MFFLKNLNFKNKFLTGSYVLFLLALLAHFIKQFLQPYGMDSWGVSEFLINYQGGFVRRGLLGEILFSFAKHFDINIEVTVKIISGIFYILLCYFFTRSFLKKGYSLYILPLCFFLGAFVLADVWLRKDTMMLCFFIAIIWLYNKKNLSAIIKIFFINLLSILMILIHEVFVFFSIPALFFLFSYLFKRKNIIVSFLLSFLSLLPSVIAFMLVILKHGDQNTAQIIWNSWQDLYSINKTDVPSMNAIGAIGWTGSHALNFHIKSNFLQIDSGILSSYVWLITFPLLYYIATNALLVFRKTKTSFTEHDKTILSSVLLFQLLFLIPVFCLLSCDYIRITSYWISSSFAIFLIIPHDTIEKLFPSIVIDKINQFNKFIYNILAPTKAIIFLMMLLIGISEWSFTLERFFRTTMLYQILWFLSKPFVILKDIYLHFYS